MFIVEIAEANGIEEDDAVFLLSIIGIANCLGRLVAGWLAGRKSINSLYLYIAACFVGGAFTIACPYLTSYTMLAIYSVVFGAFVGELSMMILKENSY